MSRRIIEVREVEFCDHDETRRHIIAERVCMDITCFDDSEHIGHRWCDGPKREVLDGPSEDMIERGFSHRWGSLYSAFPIERAKKEWEQMRGDLVAALWGEEE